MNFTNLQIEIESLPKVEAVNLKPIAKSYFKIIALNKLALYAGLIVLVFGGRYFMEKNEAVQFNLWYILSAVSVFCILNFVIGYLAFKKRKYAVREHDVIYSKGLIIHSIITVPMSRIQHVEESRSWLARYLDLATLNIYTAGEAGSDLSIKGLPYLEAKEIKEIISSKVNGTH
ncbi:PH domain-containing protein [Winogradskyella vidalii]|uniref:PH domain-containing protein n=1 Tax=Winogradskyella vidalii TaxID=2615024 RepID=UPI0015C75AC0|nr:PH domain-containing protein [Winogradskyella vidalii]